jgi:HD-like signal output (HDOD) protein
MNQTHTVTAENLNEVILQSLSVKGDLPPLPEVLINLEKRINDPDSDLESIAELVQTDPVLAGRLIKLANSVLLGGGREKADDLSSAVMRLGLKMVLDLAYTLKLPSLFVQVKGFNQLQFWKHSFSVALLSQSLARALNFSKEDQEVSYVAGLMHDLGILVFLHLIPDEYKSLMSQAGESERSLIELEQERFGIAHPELGGKFIKANWPVSPKVTEAVERHHDDVNDNVIPSHIYEIVHFANRLANSIGISHEITSHQTESFDKKLMENLGLDSTEMEKLVESTHEMVDQAEAVLKR